MSGSNTVDSAGNYGIKGITSSTNLPRASSGSSMVLDTIDGALFVLGGYLGSGSSKFEQPSRFISIL